jgi:DNA-binding transcriptional regulator GbsR (MarR family)
VNLSPLKARFVAHFGEMGSRWGINRTVGQVYALLYVSERPLTADDLIEALGFSRGNISMAMKELESWNLVRRRFQPGDRREWFEVPGDVWDILRILAEERRRREIDPTLSMLRDALMEGTNSDEDRLAQTRMAEMHELIDLLTSWSRSIQALDNATIAHLLRLGPRVARLVNVAEKLRVLPGGKGRRGSKPGETP